MGFFSNLFSLSGPDKLMASKNALVAKYTFLMQDEKHQMMIQMKVTEFLQEQGFSSKGLKEDAFFGLSVFAMGQLGIKPALSGILFKDEWQYIKNPLIALRDAEQEIKMVQREIMTRHGVEISLEH